MRRILFAGLLATTMPAMGQNMYGFDGYWGAQFSLLNQESSGDDFEPTAAQARFGLQFTPNVAVEGRLGLGVSDDEQDFDSVLGPVEVEVDPDYLVGAYLKLGVDERQPFAPYVLLGHSTVRADVTVTSSVSGASDTEEVTSSDPSYGAGFDVNLDDHNTLNLEWVMLDDDDDTDLTSINLGYSRRF